MRKVLIILQTAAIALIIGGMALPSAAQNHLQTARSFVQSPQTLAMGDAGVAFGGRESAFFYNPANLAYISNRRPSFYFTLPKPTIGTSLFEKLRFFQDEIEPAIDAGIENMSAAELSDLYNRTFAVASRRTAANLDIVLPSVYLNVNGVGVGGGFFAHSIAQFAVGDAGAGVPLINASGRADLMSIASAGMDFTPYGAPGLAAGITGKYTSRYLALKRKPLDAFGSDENLNLLRGNSVGFDVGLLYDIQHVPGLRAGLAVYDIIASDFNYTLSGGSAKNGADQASIDEEIAIASELGVSPSYRVGAAYMLPSTISGGKLRGSGFALDYVGYGNPPIQQAFFAKLHLGGQLLVIDRFALRAGLGQGYTSAGAGIYLGFARIEYAFFGQETGRIPGQLPSWNHTAQIAFGF